MRIYKQKDLFRLFIFCGKKKLLVLPRIVVMGVMLLASALAFADDVPINSTTFPDSAFRAYVQKLAGSTETLPQSVIDQKTTFGNDLNGLGIKSLKGIEYFTSLTSLTCEKNPGLTTINLIGNTKLTSLNLTGCKVTSLDVSMCKGLTGLYLSDNKLTELNVSQNTSLTTLSCVNNQLSTLDLLNNTKLQRLYLGGNRLTSLDLTSNTSLTYLTCNDNRLTSLAISSTAAPKITTLNISGNAFASVDLSTFTSLSATNSKVANQTRTMMLYTDGTDAYLKVGGGIDASKISEAKLNFTDGSTSEDLTFTVGTESDGLVPLKFSNGAVRKRFFNWTTNSTTGKATPITITYNYNTGSTLSALATMDVTFTVECYMLPMSAEYGTVNLPYDVVLPTGATAYAVTATSVKAGSDDNYATLTQIATAGEIVPANTPMLIKRADDTYTLFALNQGTGTATEATSNLLKGTQNTAIANNEYYYVLGLNNSSHELGFWRSTNSKIGTWRAYLDLSESATSAKGFFLTLDSTPTGISDMRMPSEDVDAPWYTIDGRALGAMPTQKGIYIHQGKKIVITK